ncbi:beta-lactamase family protein [Solimonas terrae]|uniref:Beta-lactamase family protein n=2 Tax=Solimonas terrae TaxID=1396819 RepID=A0A6M2BV29_9GAMM|nr:beta-lactamase family protein [Solimonas terrae]
MPKHAPLERNLEPAQPEDVGLSREGLAAVDAAVQQLIDQGTLAGALTLVARHGRTVHVNAMGSKDLASAEPMRADTLFRIYSMTKPVTATAMMILFDEGRWALDDPIGRHLPELANLAVIGQHLPDGSYTTEVAAHAPTMRELMTHTAGFGYGLLPTTAFDRLYQKAAIWKSANLTEFCARLATLPLAYQPGTKWAYSLSMDLQGAIIERLSGQSLPDFMAERIFTPLGMQDTAFHTPAEKQGRRATLYFSEKNGPLIPIANPLAPDHETPPALALGGSGLISTAGDYARFAQMLLDGGELNGHRIASREAIALQMRNHLPDTMLDAGYVAGHQRLRPGFGFGFNGVVFTDPALAGIPVGKGTYHWDGAAGTWFWVDPENDLLFIGLIQLMSYSAPPLQATTQTLMADAIVR